MPYFFVKEAEMHGVIFFAILFVAKVIDNALSTAKTILIQRSRWIIAGVIVMLSDMFTRNFLYRDNDRDSDSKG